MRGGLIIVDGYVPTSLDTTNLRADPWSIALDQRAFGPRHLLVAFVDADGRFRGLAFTVRTDPIEAAFEARLDYLGRGAAAVIAYSDEPVTDGPPPAEYLHRLPRAEHIAAAFERKSLADLVSSLTSGRLRYALGELAALPRAAVVVEDRYSQVFAQQQVRPALVADGLAELQVRWSSVPLVFCETRKLAEEWTYRFLAAALEWFRDDADVSALLVDHETPALEGPVPDAGGRAASPATSEVRAWARANGFAVPDRGRLRPQVIAAWHEANASS